MLILSRKPGEMIDIDLPNGEMITVTLSSLDGKRAKIGFECPPEYMVLRREVKDRMGQADET